MKGAHELCTKRKLEKQVLWFTPLIDTGSEAQRGKDTFSQSHAINTSWASTSPNGSKKKPCELSNYCLLSRVHAGPTPFWWNAKLPPPCSQGVESSLLPQQTVTSAKQDCVTCVYCSLSTAQGTHGGLQGTHRERDFPPCCGAWNWAFIN